MPESATVPAVQSGTFLDDPFFRSTFENFDKLRGRTEPRGVWRRSGQARGETGEEGKAGNEGRNGHESCLPPGGGSGGLAWDLVTGIFNTEWARRFNGDGAAAKAEVVEDDGALEVRLDASGYKPDELKVAVKDGVIVVEGRRAGGSEDGRQTVSRMFCKRCSLPRGTGPEDVTSSLSPGGLLVVVVDKKGRDMPRTVPITTL